MYVMHINGILVNIERSTGLDFVVLKKTKHLEQFCNNYLWKTKDGYLDWHLESDIFGIEEYGALGAP
jgi:hypothetical protein